MRSPLPLAAALALLLTACAPGPEPAPSVTPTPTPAFQAQPADIPPGDYAPWQEAYMDFLAQLCGEEATVYTRYKETEAAGHSPEPELWNTVNTSSDHYLLYDVDKDDTPELFIAFGHLASPIYRCYTYRAGQVLEIGTVEEGSASFHTWPDENGVLVTWGRMSHWGGTRYRIVDGKLEAGELVYDQDLAWVREHGCKAPSQYVPGTAPIPPYYTHTRHEVDDTPALLLPICDWDPTRRAESRPQSEHLVRRIIGTVLRGQRSFLGVPGDNFDGGTGRITLPEYLTPQGAYPYTDKPLTPTALAWADVNGDGQTDCILRLEKGPDENGNTNSFYTVFHFQDERVYAYFFNFVYGFGVDPDGTVYFKTYNGTWGGKISFYQDQCYTFPAGEPVEGCDLAWDPFVPTPPQPDLSLPQGDYSPWQRAYMDYLTDLCKQESPLLRWAEEATSQEKEADPDRWLEAMMCSDVYWLYDVDKDGTPELFIRYGNMARLDEIWCYTCREGKVVRIGEIRDAKGAHLYAWPGENAVLNYWAWKGAFILWKYSIVDGELVCENEDGIHSQFGGPGEPDPRDHIPDTLPLEYCRVRTSYPDGQPLLLPICAGGGPWAPAEQEDPAAAREAMEAVLYHNAYFYSASGGSDVYVGPTGWITLDAYCQEASDAPFPHQMVWLDLSGDGAEDCILRLEEHHSDLLVLHWQDGVVYGCGISYYGGHNVTEKGIFYRSDPLWIEDTWGKTLSFHKNQCYWTAVPLPADPAPAAWEPFPANL